MCMLGGSKPTPSLPAPIAPPPIVDTSRDNVASNDARDKQQKAAAAAQGQKSTIASTALGVTDPATVKKATVLGQTA
jgi:hypothetical protein